MLYQDRYIIATVEELKMNKKITLIITLKNYIFTHIYVIIKYYI